MSSKKQTTTYNHYVELKKSLYDIYSRMESFQESLEWLIEQKQKWRENTHHKKLTNYYRGVLSGMDDVLYGNLRKQLAWVFIWKNETGEEQITSGWENMPENIRMDSTKFKGIHVWIKKQAHNRNPEITTPIKRFNRED